ncbi:MAG: zinc-ribbon domain-containing protein [Fimbriimonas sp.]|nr:zinc-ribbon domain-containing protein [Fimbriimonas sp.]
MITCTKCGEQNPDGVYRCNKCGVMLGHQVRARADAQRSKVVSGVRLVWWIVVVIAVIVIAPRLYHFAFASFYRYRMNTQTAAAVKNCNGPATETTTPAQKAEIDKCVDTDPIVVKARGDYEDFTKGDKP